MKLSASRITRKDLCWLLLGSAFLGLSWLVPYFIWRSDAISTRFSYNTHIPFLIAAGVCAMMLLVGNRYHHPRHWQKFAWLAKLACGVILYALFSRLPNPLMLGQWHRLSAKVDPQTLVDFSRWALSKAVGTKDGAAQLDDQQTAALLETAEGRRFQCIAEAWGVPSLNIDSEGDSLSGMNLIWTGGFSRDHWGVTVQEHPPHFLNTWKAAEGVFFWRTDNCYIE